MNSLRERKFFSLPPTVGHDPQIRDFSIFFGYYKLKKGAQEIYGVCRWILNQILQNLRKLNQVLVESLRIF